MLMIPRIKYLYVTPIYGSMLLLTRFKLLDDHPSGWFRSIRLLVPQSRGICQVSKLPVKGDESFIFVSPTLALERQSSSYVNIINSWSAVVRGAVLYGVDGIVESRKLKRHYGVRMGTIFNPAIHDEVDAFHDVFDNIKWSRDNVEWLGSKVGYLRPICLLSRTSEQLVSFSSANSLVGCRRLN